MHEKLRKMLGVAASASPEMETKLNEVVSELSTVKEALTLKSDEAAQAVAKLSSLSLEKESVELALAETLEKFTQLQNSHSEFMAKLENDKQTARLKQLTDVMGDVRGKAAYEAVKSLDDASFATVVDGFKVSMEVEKQSPAFTEIGASGEDVSTTAETLEAKMLKQMFPQK